jgi:hypothetical protein
MLAISGGALMMLSTPAGQRGIFFEEWTEGAGWERYEVPIEDVPRISPEFVEEERRALPRRVFDQEYRCKFVEIEDAVFSLEDIENAIRTDIEPLFGETS